MPADWFPRETHGMLAQYCRHVVAARRVAQLIERVEAAPEFCIESYERLLRMQDKETRGMSLLATRMRLTQHTSKTYAAARKPSMVPKPWEDCDD
jgi:3-methyladenine DNA glycosylase/8-oxoguanine DNA glycosylase